MTNELVSGGGGDETNSSPKNRVKFLCSHGGKILPRPPDGQLKYVGGETRVIAVPRDINFSELMKKLSTEFEGDMVLKYQVMSEDLDVLVSVKTDEDLKHMLDEYDRHESEGTPKLRAFLFPSNCAVIENHTMAVDPLAIEQRYIDAINGSVRMTASLRLPHINANHPTFSLSACSSPNSTSPESSNIESMAHETTFVNNKHNSRPPILKVYSSPSLCSLNSPHHQGNSISNHHAYQHHHHYCQHYPQHHPYSYQPSRPPHDPHRLPATLSLGRPEFGRATHGHGPSQYYSGRHNMGSGNSNEYGYYDEHSAYAIRAAVASDSLPPSPRKKILE